ncbi:hypothetical protein FXF51_05550 [Nonomuraea sp. PA05]|uniref:hypothetical protein n=1 Tax=Nonomuraea sp. PA05 TaxID=2604466 RepID=UPI0011D73DC6|nr:hypothetical protein [Nonomuraea sp. PA05]TYB69630.1 hypothetical protein FXF51_05550 [Nonomuraea sp. PA05]
MADAITLLVFCLPIVTLCYSMFCLASPWGTCVRCRPAGKNRTCRACNGTGKRPRLGWQLYVYARRLYRDGDH